MRSEQRKNIFNLWSHSREDEIDGKQKEKQWTNGTINRLEGKKREEKQEKEENTKKSSLKGSLTNNLQQVRKIENPHYNMENTSHCRNEIIQQKTESEDMHKIPPRKETKTQIHRKRLESRAAIMK